jgi:tricorn protease-like protein
MKEMEQETMMNSSLSIYPNPVTNVLSISFPNDNINSTINLYDMLGEKVLPSYSTQSTNYTIDLKNLSQGIYFLEVIMDGEKVVRKVIKL